MQKIILILVIVLTPVMALAHGDEHGELIIRMTNEGFEPKELTVTEGDEVIFINNDDTSRWPASNFHPTHNLYPEFDPLKAIAPGESWKFTFAKPGTWRMHDHLIPHMTGAIVVLEAPETEKGVTLESDELETENRQGFWAKIKNFFIALWRKVFERKSVSAEKVGYASLIKIAEEKGSEAAWRHVKAAYDTPAGVVGSPHDMAHLVGQLIYKERDFDGLSICDPTFAFGCYHGLMQVAFDGNTQREYEKNLIKAEEGCGKIGEETSPTYWSCVHGMGHGIATFREHDLEKSLSDCDTFESSIRTYCHDGVFMEFSISAPPSFYKKNEPIYPCNDVGENYKVACARSQVQVMRLRLGMETGAIAKTCAETGNENIIFHCVDALGYFIAQTAGGDASKIISGCQEIEDEAAAAQCLAAAAGELVFQNAVGWQKSVKEICQNDKSCEERVGRVKKSYGRE